mgnify:CR=1 FL=1
MRKMRLLKVYRGRNQPEPHRPEHHEDACLLLRSALDECKPFLIGLENMGLELSVAPTLTAFYCDLDKRCSAMLAAQNKRKEAGQKDRERYRHAVGKCLDMALDLRSVCENLYKFLSVALRATENMGGAGRALAFSLVGIIRLPPFAPPAYVLADYARRALAEYGVKHKSDGFKNALGKETDLPGLIDRLDVLCPFSSSYYRCLRFLAQEYHPIVTRVGAMLRHLSREESNERIAFLSHVLSWPVMRSDSLDTREKQFERFMDALDHLIDREPPRLSVVRTKSAFTIMPKRFSFDMRARTERDMSLFLTAIGSVAFPVVEQLRELSPAGFEDYIKRLRASCARHFAYYERVDAYDGETKKVRIIRKRALFGLQHVVNFGDRDALYAVKRAYALIELTLSWQKYALLEAARTGERNSIAEAQNNQSLSLLKNTLRDIAQIRAIIAKRIAFVQKQMPQDRLEKPINPVLNSDELAAYAYHADSFPRKSQEVVHDSSP